YREAWELDRTTFRNRVDPEEQRLPRLLGARRIPPAVRPRRVGWPPGDHCEPARRPARTARRIVVASRLEQRPFARPLRDRAPPLRRRSASAAFHNRGL